MKPQRALRKYGSEIQTLTKQNVDSFIRQTYELYKEYWIHTGNKDNKVKFYHKHSGATEGKWIQSKELENIQAIVHYNFPKIIPSTGEKKTNELLGQYCLNEKDILNVSFIEFKVSADNAEYSLIEKPKADTSPSESKYLFLPEKKGIYLNETIHVKKGITSFELFLIK